jgi:hypothetical protein
MSPGAGGLDAALVAALTTALDRGQPPRPRPAMPRRATDLGRRVRWFAGGQSGYPTTVVASGPSRALRDRGLHATASLTTEGLETVTVSRRVLT